MSSPALNLLVAVCFVFLLHGSVSAQQPDTKDKAVSDQQEADAARINKLILQLGSTKFPEREAATKQLEAIGEPALDPLRAAAKTSLDIETRRRVEQIADKVELIILEKLVKDGTHYNQKKDFKMAASLFDKAIRMGTKRYHPGVKAPESDIPFLNEVYLLSARNFRDLGEFDKAAKAYYSAVYYANYNREKRQQLDDERWQMATQLVSDWTGSVKAKADKDAASKKLIAKYPLVVLHSRRYAGGDYLQSAYSFLYETSVERKHYNDVQILFDNGQRDCSFEVRMVSNQRNRVADLGPVDFENNPDPAKVGVNDGTKWSNDECKAIEGHVYLENVKDEDGNDFYVLFKMIAVDKDSRYAAFVWRRMPGGTTVKRAK